MLTNAPRILRNSSAGATPLLGIEIGGTKLQLAISAEPGRVDELARLDVGPGGAAGIRAAIESVLPILLDGRRVRAAAIGFGGPVDRATGTVATSHQVGGWDDFPLADWLSRLVGNAPVAIENDSNAAALGEAIHGAGRGCDPVFYFNAGTGIGGGLVVGGRLYHARPPGEVEFGHLRLDRAGTTLEDRCAGVAVDRLVREAVARDPTSILAERVRSQPHPGGEARHLGPAADADDPAAIALLASVGDDISWALSHAVHLLHPQVIVFGGGLSLVGSRLIGVISERLRTYTMRAFHPVPMIRPAGLAELAVPIGALELAGTTAALG